jgi:acyl-CoA thioester hydrolase
MTNSMANDSEAIQKINSYPYKTIDTIRFQDVDRNNHVNNIAFAIYGETGRTNFVDHLFEEFGDKIDFVVARLTVDYLKQAYFPGSVEVGTAVQVIGTKSCTLIQGIFCNGECIGTSETVWVYFNRQENHSEVIPDDVRALLEKYKLKTP